MKGIADHYERVDGSHVHVAHSREVLVRKRGIEPVAVTRHAAAQRTRERVERPVADAGFAIRRDVGRIDSAERRVERETTGEWLAARSGMTNDAIADRGQLR